MPWSEFWTLALQVLIAGAALIFVTPAFYVFIFNVRRAWYSGQVAAKRDAKREGLL